MHPLLLMVGYVTPSGYLFIKISSFGELTWWWPCGGRKPLLPRGNFDQVRLDLSGTNAHCVGVSPVVFQ